VLKRFSVVLVMALAATAGPAVGEQAPGAVGQGIYLPQLIVEQPSIAIGASCLSERRVHRPTGDLVVVPGTSPVAGTGERLISYIVEVEEGLALDPDCFARVVELTLGDERSWIGSGRWSMQRVDEGPADLRVTLASPPTVDAYCLPLRTGGIFSCWDGSHAMINVWRWEEGASDFEGRIGEYRAYVINHEVGHGLGFGHVGCPGSGELAPVMMQQSKSTGACLPNGWPTERER
jgi:hypothetical protein